MPRIFSIEGNIGSGKSTLIKELEKYYNEKNKNGLKICFIQEPVNIWNTITDANGKKIIEHFYTNPDKYAFSFQMMAYISRLTLIKEALNKSYEIIFTERCIFTDKNVFAKMLYDNKFINEIEYKIYNLWFYSFFNDMPKIEYIYLRTDPAIAYSRVQKRNREGECITLQYLQSCHDYHEHWLNNIQNKYIIDYNNNEATQTETIADTIKLINSYTEIYTITFCSILSNKLVNRTVNICGISYIIWKNNERFYEEKSVITINKTKIYTEYIILIKSLKKCNELKIKNVIIKGQTNVLIDQLNKKCIIEPNNLLPLYNEVLDYLYDFNTFKFIYVQTHKFNKPTKELALSAIKSYESGVHKLDTNDYMDTGGVGAT